MDGLARCRRRAHRQGALPRARRGNKLTVRLVDGFPGDTFNVEISSGEAQSGALDSTGRARVRYKRLASGDGTAAAAWGCGASGEESYQCP
ncbi:MAG: hypothetical protein IT449_05420 [Phycisphaerales bacterium]|nr:hypothetical protein [Phycisphaerales bacterium]